MLKKLLSVGVIFLLIGLSSLSSVTSKGTLNNENVNIEIKGGLGVRISLFNNKTISIDDTICEIKIDADLLLTEQDFTIEISEFLSKDTIFTRIYTLGFGKINATVQFGELTLSRNGLLIGLFVIFI